MSLRVFNLGNAKDLQLENWEFIPLNDLTSSAKRHVPLTFQVQKESISCFSLHMDKMYNILYILYKFIDGLKPDFNAPKSPSL